MISSSLGAALGIAEQLPRDAATSLVEIARRAFTDGLGAATVTGGLVLAAAAIVCPLLLRRGRTARAEAGREHSTLET